MFKKLFLAYVVLLIVSLIVFGIVLAQTTRARMTEEMERRLEADAELLRVLIGVLPGAVPLQSTLQGMSSRLEVRLTVIGPDGKVVADSHADPAGMENHSLRPEVLAAREGGRGRDVRYSDTMRYDTLYLALRLENGQIARAALPLSRVDQEVGAVYRGVALAFLVIVLVGTAVTYLISREVTQPLREVRYLADWIAAGDFTRRASHRGGDEMGHVSAALNRMADELSARLEGLKAERSKLEAVISSMQEGVIAVDPGGKILHVNSAARSLFDLRDDPQGLILWEAIRLPGLESAALGVLRGGAPVAPTFEVGPRVLTLRLTPVQGSQGAVLVARDITEDRRYDNLRKEFVANVSHELRTPLTVIQGYVETLVEGAWKDEKSAHDFLTIIDKNVRRLSAIVRDLLDLSKLESGGQVIEPATVDVRGLLDRVAEAFRPVAERRRQELSVDGKDRVEDLDADPALLERAISNLVDNALKYTPEGGRVKLRAEPMEDGVAISVQDTGTGIPEADLPRVFERFYRVEKSRSRDSGGTGLGLAIVKHVAQLHGGSITVRSTLGAGSTFTLRIPHSLRSRES